MRWCALGVLSVFASLIPEIACQTSTIPSTITAIGHGDNTVVTFDSDDLTLTELDRVGWVLRSDAEAAGVAACHNAESVSFLDGDLSSTFSLEEGEYVLCYQGTGSLRTCMDHLVTGTTTSSGVAVIHPRGTADTLEVLCDQATDGGGWTRVVAQDTSGDPELWEQFANNMNAHDPEHPEVYGILGYLESFRTTEERFEMRMAWPDSGLPQNQQWYQSSNPVGEEIGSIPSDYEPIDVFFEVNSFQGLQGNTAQHRSRLDGQSGEDPGVNQNWAYALGVVDPENGGTPSPYGGPVDKSELWLRDDGYWQLSEVTVLTVAACPGIPAGTLCSGNGVCEIDGTCTCLLGYWNSGCDQICPGGIANPCSSSGTCDVVTGECDCDAGHYGDACSYAVDAISHSTVLAGTAATIELSGANLQSGDQLSFISTDEDDGACGTLPGAVTVLPDIEVVINLDPGNYKLCYRFSDLGWFAYSSKELVAQGVLQVTEDNIFDATINPQHALTLEGYGLVAQDRLSLVADGVACPTSGGEVAAALPEVSGMTRVSAAFSLDQGDYTLCYDHGGDGSFTRYDDVTLQVRGISGITPSDVLAGEIVALTITGVGVGDDEVKFTSGSDCSQDSAAYGQLSSGSYEATFSYGGVFALCYKWPHDDQEDEWVLYQDWTVEVTEDENAPCSIRFLEMATELANPASYWREGGYRVRTCDIIFAPQLNSDEEVNSAQMVLELPEIDIDCDRGHNLLVYEMRYGTEDLEVDEAEPGDASQTASGCRSSDFANDYISSKGFYFRILLDVGDDAEDATTTYSGFQAQYHIRPVIESSSPQEGLYSDGAQIAINGKHLLSGHTDCRLAPSPYEDGSNPRVGTSSDTLVLCELPAIASPSLETYTVELTTNGRDWYSADSFTFFEEKCQPLKQLTDSAGTFRDKGFGVASLESTSCVWEIQPSHNFTTIVSSVVFDFEDRSCADVSISFEWIPVGLTDVSSLQLCGNVVPDADICQEVSSGGFKCSFQSDSDMQVTYQTTDAGGDGVYFEAAWLTDPVLQKLSPSEGLFNEEVTVVVVGEGFSSYSVCGIEGRDGTVETATVHNSTVMECKTLPQSSGDVQIHVFNSVGIAISENETESLSTHSTGSTFSLLGCPSGMFAEDPLTRCQPCLFGFFSEYNSTECSKCPGGTWSNIPKASACELCQLGTFRNTTDDATSCFSCEAPLYQDEEGQSSCKSCAHYSPEYEDTDSMYVTFPLEGATSVSECFCAEGHYDIYFGMNETVLCQPCPEQSNCGSETRHPTTKRIEAAPADGHYAISIDFPRNIDPVFFHPCNPAESCLGGPDSTCAEGYRGFLCGQCDSGFYKLEGFCEPCAVTENKGVIALYFIAGAAFLIALGTIALLRKPFSKSSVSWLGFTGAVSILVGYAQILSLFGSFKIPWPEIVTDWMKVTSFFNFNYELAQPECQFPDMTYSEKWTFVMVLPVCALGVFIIFGLSLTAYLKLRTRRLLERMENLNARLQRQTSKSNLARQSTLARIEQVNQELQNEILEEKLDTPRSQKSDSSSSSSSSSSPSHSGRASSKEDPPAERSHSRASLSELEKEIEPPFPALLVNEPEEDVPPIESEVDAEEGESDAKAGISQYDGAGDGDNEISNATSAVPGILTTVPTDLNETLGGSSNMSDTLASLQPQPRQRRATFFGGRTKRASIMVPDIASLVTKTAKLPPLLNNDILKEKREAQLFPSLLSKQERVIKTHIPADCPLDHIHARISEECGFTYTGDYKMSHHADGGYEAVVELSEEKYRELLSEGFLLDRPRSRSQSMRPTKIISPSMSPNARPSAPKQKHRALESKRPSTIDPSGVREKEKEKETDKKDISRLKKRASVVSFAGSDANESAKSASASGMNSPGMNSPGASLFARRWSVVTPTLKRRFSLAWGWVDVDPTTPGGQRRMRTADMTSWIYAEEHALLLRVWFSMCNAFLMFLTLGYIFIARTAMEVFDCTETPDGSLILEVDTRIRCEMDDDVYATLVPQAIVACIFYVGGIPVLLFLFVFLNRRHLHDERSFYAFGYLFEKYEAEWYFWEIVLIAKKLALVVVHRFFTNRPLFQTILALLAMLTSTSAQLYAKPFRIDHHDVMEAVLLVSNFLVLFLGLLFLADRWPQEDGTDWIDVFAHLTLIIFMSGICGTVLTVIGSFIHSARSKTHASLQELQVRELFQQLIATHGEGLFQFLEETVQEKHLPNFLHWMYNRGLKGEVDLNILDCARFVFLVGSKQSKKVEEDVEVVDDGDEDVASLNSADRLLLIKVYRKVLQEHRALMKHQLQQEIADEAVMEAEEAIAESDEDKIASPSIARAPPRRQISQMSFKSVSSVGGPTPHAFLMSDGDFGWDAAAIDSLFDDAEASSASHSPEPIVNVVPLEATADDSDDRHDFEVVEPEVGDEGLQKVVDISDVDSDHDVLDEDGEQHGDDDASRRSNVEDK